MHAEVMRTAMLNLLMGFTVTVDWRPVSLIWSAQRLVAFLALAEKPPGRAYVAGALWPETTTARANASLRSSLWRVHQACGRLVVASPQRLCLAPEVVIDVHS